MRQNEKGSSKSGHHKPFPSPVSSLKPPSQQQAYKDFFFSMQKMKKNKKFTRTRDVTRRKYLCSAHPNLRSCSCLSKQSIYCFFDYTLQSYPYRMSSIPESLWIRFFFFIRSVIGGCVHLIKQKVHKYWLDNPHVYKLEPAKC